MNSLICHYGWNVVRTWILSFLVHCIYYQSQKIPAFLLCNIFCQYSTLVPSLIPYTHTPTHTHTHTTHTQFSLCFLPVTWEKHLELGDGIPGKVFLSFLFQKKRKPFVKLSYLAWLTLWLFQDILNIWNRDHGVIIMNAFLLVNVFLWKKSLRGVAVEPVQCSQKFSVCCSVKSLVIFSAGRNL